jgi:hypothetical protein
MLLSGIYVESDLMIRMLLYKARRVSDLRCVDGNNALR